MFKGLPKRVNKDLVWGRFWKKVTVPLLTAAISGAPVADKDVVFYVRNLGVTILGTYRIVYDSKTYIIHGIKEIDGREKFLEIETKLKDNN